MELTSRRRGRGRPVRWAALLAVVALTAAACGDDDDDDTADTTAGTTATTAETTDTTAESSDTTAATTGTTTGGSGSRPSGPDLGPENVASGDPVKVGLFHDGTTAAVDHGDDSIVADAIVDYWNEHQGGIGGRPVELVICETNSDPGLATDCGNRFVEEGVVFVSNGASGFTQTVWEPVNAAGIPVVVASGAQPAMTADGALTAILSNGLAQTHAFGVAVAVRDGIDTVVTLVIDVPAAVEPMAFMQAAADAAGLDYSYVAITPGTPDMLPQLTAAMQSDPGMITLIGDPAFCLVALRGLYELDYPGTILTADYCIDPEAFEPLPVDKLQEIVVSGSAAMGDDTDPDWQLYAAIMDEYASEAPGQDAVRGWTYQSLFVPLLALRDLTGEITPAAAAEAINSATGDLPLGAGIEYRCDDTAFTPAPAYCVAAALETGLDADLAYVDYEGLDVSTQLDAIAEFMLGG